MKKSNAFYLYALAVAMLFTTLPLSAQFTPFGMANEVMMSEQATLTSYVAITFGPDPASPLTFSTYVDPAGQSFNFSLNAGSTYLGQPITLTTSGTLTSHSVWVISASFTYNGTPWTMNSTYVQPNALGYGPPRRPFYNLPTYIMDSITSGGYCFTCTNVFVGTLPVTYNGPDMNTVVTFIGGYPAPGSNFGGYSNVNGTSPIVWTYSIMTAGGNTSSLTGNTPADGSEGNSTAVVDSVSVSTVSYFSDLGSGASTYQCCYGWSVSGSGSGGGYTAANEFTAGSSGSVSRIDIGIGSFSGTNSFFAALYTASGGSPGTLIAQWNNLGTNLPEGQCCGVVTIPNITGVNLTAGTSYFLVLGPTSLTSTASLSWNLNSTGTTGLDLYATSGCQNGSGNGCSWNSNGNNSTLGAFDILSQPEGIQSNANLFTSTASGAVSEIDIAVGYVSGINSFSATLSTDNNGVPGVTLDQWDNLTATETFGQCCGLLSITGITGVSLTAGQQYFLVLSPGNPGSTTSAQWNLNTTGATGLDVFSLDSGPVEGRAWNSRGQMALGAFYIYGSFGGGNFGTFFSDLGTGDTVYQCCFGWPITGGTGAPQSLVAGKKK